MHRANLVGCLLFGGIALFAQAPPRTAKEAINLANWALRDNRYDDAEAAFGLAASLDPKDPQIQIMLGTMLASQPNGIRPDQSRLERAKRAAAAYRLAVQIDPNPGTLRMLAQLLHNESLFAKEPERTQFLDEATVLFRRLLGLNPADKNALRTLGTMAVPKANDVVREARMKLRMEPDEPGPLKDPRVRADARSRVGGVIDEGIADLSKTIQLDSEDEGSMASLSALYRTRADLQDAAEASRRDIASADQWRKKARETTDQRFQAETNRPFGSYTRPHAWVFRGAASCIRVSAREHAAKLTKKVDPWYPEEAKKAGVQGSVQFAVSIDSYGKLLTAKLLNGDPLLVQAALDALRAYVYEPTHLNNERVVVETEVEVEVKPISVPRRGH